MMDISEKLALFERAIGYEGAPLSIAEKLSEVVEWDSMGIFGFIVMLGKECGKRIDLQDVKGLETVQDAIDLMRSSE